MAGLVPAIHDSAPWLPDVDARNKSGHDDVWECWRAETTRQPDNKRTNFGIGTLDSTPRTP